MDRLDADGIRAAALAELPRHRSLIRSARDGAWLSAFQRRLYRIWVPPGHAVLTTTGRRTGRQRAKCIRATQDGSSVFVVMLRPPLVAAKDPMALAAWVRNIRADPNVQMQLGRTTHQGTARELRAADELATARRVFTEGVYLVDYAEFMLHMRGLPTAAKVRELHRYWFDTGVPIVVDLSPGKRT